jgi:hypothetical protein
MAKCRSSPLETKETWVFFLAANDGTVGPLRHAHVLLANSRLLFGERPRVSRVTGERGQKHEWGGSSPPGTEAGERSELKRRRRPVVLRWGSSSSEINIMYLGVAIQ